MVVIGEGGQFGRTVRTRIARPVTGGRTVPSPTDHNPHVPACSVAPADGDRTSDGRVTGIDIPLPVGLQKVMLTEQEANAIRDLLDDMSQPGYAGGRW